MDDGYLERLADLVVGFGANSINPPVDYPALL
jgi:hypothetical protein